MLGLLLLLNAPLDDETSDVCSIEMKLEFPPEVETGIWSQIPEIEAQIKEAIQKEVARILGEGYYVRKVFYARGSLTILATIAALYKGIADYPKFKEGCRTLAKDIPAVIRSILAARIPTFSLSSRLISIVAPQRRETLHLIAVLLIAYVLLTHIAMLVVFLLPHLKNA